MKRFTINLIATFLAFAAGLATNISWNSNRRAVFIEPVGVNVLERCPPSQIQPLRSTQPPIVVAPEFVFAQGHLKLVPEQVQLRSESLKYEIDVSYPQIVGTDDPFIRKVNQNIKQVATEKYQWPLSQSIGSLNLIQKNHSGALNIVNLTYEVGLATDSLLSIYFTGYHSGSGAPQSAQEMLTLNYDLTSGKQLKLSDMFRPGSKYLEFISRYCIDELSIGNEIQSQEAVAPVAQNFESWHITSNGISFNFDGCKVFGCVTGDQTVDIPFSDLKPVLKPDIPGMFKITYP